MIFVEGWSFDLLSPGAKNPSYAIFFTGFRVKSLPMNEYK
jgi:hypothetical protein